MGYRGLSRKDKGGNVKGEIFAFSKEHCNKFPSGFLWGTATSAHQVDGGNTNNNWWRWEAVEGNIRDGDRSGIACDHWNRYEEDFDILEDLNQNAYRFSLEWSRIVPEKGVVDEGALDHYHKLIASLRRRGIEPIITLHHFTEPVWLTRLGGIKRERSVRFFREYVERVAKELSDEVSYWNTVNEPNIRAFGGFFQGNHPPGEKGFINYLRAIRNLIRMHAEAYQALKDVDTSNLVGLVKCINIFEPNNPVSVQDRFLAEFLDYFANEITLRALKTGKLPLSFIREYEGLKGSSDFIGLNYYSRQFCSPRFPRLIRMHSDEPDPSRLCVGLGWEAYPEGLYLCLKRLWQELGLPIFVTENGIGTDDDVWRQEFLIKHLRYVLRAIREGIPVRGYFHWSFIDNFEWAEGYAPRFGLVSCDRETLKRTIKDSGNLYARISQENRLPAN